jgi:hypothetical protein
MTIINADTLGQLREIFTGSPTDTTPAAVERFNFIQQVGMPNANNAYVHHSDYAALSAKLEAAHAKGYAKGLRDAAACLGHITRFEDLAAILALIPADTSACDTKTAENATQTDLCKENVTQEAAKE